MALACLVCHSVESPSRSFRSYSISSSENDGYCSGISTCLAKKVTLFSENNTTSKVTPVSFVADSQGTPRLIRSHAITRDRVRDWNFDEVNVDN